MLMIRKGISVTFKELFKSQHPDCNDIDMAKVVELDCPHVHYSVEVPDSCDAGADISDCAKCWTREVPESVLKTVGVIEDKDLTGAPGPEGKPGMSIKDSGDRTEFETGAVRDMREGKGRCDLMPLKVVAKCLRCRDCGDPRNESEARVIDCIAEFQETGDSKYLVDALNFFPGYSTWEDMFLEVAKHFEEGAKKYGESNWQKGIPTKCYIDSAVRHYIKWLRGDNDEPHNRAFVWNVMCCIWEHDYGEEARKRVRTK